MNRENTELLYFLKTINLMNGNHQFYKERERKFYQIQEYGKQVNSILKKLSKKRTLTFVDCGAGSCYLSFYLNFAFRNSKIQFICIDYNKKLMDRARDTARTLGYDNMQFVSSDINKYLPPRRPDLVYSLHACDTATDMTLSLGLRSRARNLLTVSCCQRYTYDQIRNHPLGRLTENKVYKTRITDMVGDTMRGLFLESCGYDTDIFEFSSSKHTDKNVMLRAVQIPLTEERKARARMDYNYLKNFFHIEPKLRDFQEQAEDGIDLEKYKVS